MSHDWTGTKPRSHPEDDLQMAIWQHIMLRKPDNVIAYHPANGGLRSKRTAARMKRLGVVAGVADLAFVLADGSAAFLELKAGKGRQSDFQKAFAAQCASMGVPYACSNNLDQCLEILKGWGVLK